jgi:hypothetical protein
MDEDQSRREHELFVARDIAGRVVVAFLGVLGLSYAAAVIVAMLMGRL